MAVSLLLPVTSVYAQQYSSASYKILDSVLNAGGFATSSNYQLWSSLSETALGTSSSATYQAGGGFLRFPSVTIPVVSATSSDSSVQLSWTASQGYLGWTVANYSIGKATTTGGPYTFTNVGNGTSYTMTGLTNGVPYYFIVVANDFFGTSIATSSEVFATPINASFTFTLSTNSVYFGTLTPSATKYASSTNPAGDFNESEAHTIQVTTSAVNGYMLTVQGKTLTSVDHTWDEIMPLLTNTTPATGTGQFGLRAVAAGGTGVVNSPYNGSGFAFTSTATSSSLVGGTSSGDGATTTYSLRYMVNIDTTVAASTYMTDLVYVATSNF
jgi:hypothetical protein